MGTVCQFIQLLEKVGADDSSMKEHPLLKDVYDLSASINVTTLYPKNCLMRATPLIITNAKRVWLTKQYEGIPPIFGCHC